jgi:hypothetical protein
LLAFQGLPRIYRPDGFGFDSKWVPYYAVVTSINPVSTTHFDSCQTVYQNFLLVDCGNEVYGIFQADNVGCQNGSCLYPAFNQPINFCDPNGGPCLVGIVNLGDQDGKFPEHCYIEVFFVGLFEKQEIPPGFGNPTYPGNTVLASLRWSATADFMKTNNGVMLNCTNHTI